MTLYDRMLKLLYETDTYFCQGYDGPLTKGHCIDQGSKIFLCTREMQEYQTDEVICV